MDRQPLSEEALQRALAMLPHNIRRLRLARGMSQVRLAQAARLTRVAVWQIEGGRIRDPHVMTLLKLACGLGVSVDALLSDNAPAAPSRPAKRKRPKR